MYSTKAFGFWNSFYAMELTIIEVSVSLAPEVFSCNSDNRRQVPTLWKSPTVQVTLSAKEKAKNGIYSPLQTLALQDACCIIQLATTTPTSNARTWTSSPQSWGAFG